MKWLATIGARGALVFWLCMHWLAHAQLAQNRHDQEQLPLSDASVDAMIEKLAPAPAAIPGSSAVTRGLRNLVPQAQPGALAQTPATPRELVLVVQFDFGSAALGASSRQLLDNLSQALNSDRLTNSRFRIEGHTDAKGSAAYNRALSLRRAQAVVDHVVAQGVAPSRLESVGYGFEVLLLKDNPFAAENRRVRIVALD